MERSEKREETESSNQGCHLFSSTQLTWDSRCSPNCGRLCWLRIFVFLFFFGLFIGCLFCSLFLCVSFFLPKRPLKFVFVESRRDSCMGNLGLLPFSSAARARVSGIFSLVCVFLVLSLSQIWAIRDKAANVSKSPSFLPKVSFFWFSKENEYVRRH